MKSLKNSLAGLLLMGVAMSSLAVDTTDYSQPGMKQLAVEKRAMESCMGQVDEIEQIRIETQLNKLDNRLRDLCQAGKTAEAKTAALALSEKMGGSEVFQQIQKCTKPMRDLGFLPQLPVVSPGTKSLDFICGNYTR